MVYFSIWHYTQQSFRAFIQLDHQKQVSLHLNSLQIHLFWYYPDGQKYTGAHVDAETSWLFAVFTPTLFTGISNNLVDGNTIAESSPFIFWAFM